MTFIVAVGADSGFDGLPIAAACSSGAQIITTDYHYKSTFFPSDYSVSFEGGTYVRRMP